MKIEFDDIKKKNFEAQNVQKNMAELKENIPYEDMTSLVLELKTCIKSYRSISNVMFSGIWSRSNHFRNGHLFTPLEILP